MILVLQELSIQGHLNECRLLLSLSNAKTSFWITKAVLNAREAL